MRILPCLLVLLFISCTSNHKQTDNHQVMSESKKSTTNFDIDEWHVFNTKGHGSWTYTDGILYTEGGGGDLVSNEVYDDFEITFEWKLDSLGNSGVFFNVLEESAKYNTVYESGPEFQLLDDASYPTRGKKQLSGANYDMHPTEGTTIHSANQWNKGKLSVKGNQVRQFVENALVVEYELHSDDWNDRVNQSKWKDFPHYGTADEGKLAFQDHGGPVWFRNIVITKL